MADPGTQSEPPTDSPSAHEMSVQVQVVSTNERVWFHLKGSLVVCERSQRTRESILYTPVEQVEVLPPGRRVSGGQFASAAIPSGVLGIAATVFTIDWLAGGNPSDAGLPMILWGLFVCVASVAALLAMRGRPTARLRLGRHARIIEFWYRPGTDRLLDLFFFRLHQARRAVGEPAAMGPIERVTQKETFGLRQLVLATAVFGVAGLLFANRYRSALPLLAMLVPVAAYALRGRMRRRETRELRMARTHWARGEHEQASTFLNAFLAKRPRHLPAWRMLVDLYLSNEQYTEAFECCNAMEALGVLDPPVADGVRRYVRLRQELDERWRGAGFRAVPSQPGDVPPPAPPQR
jgi:hypothetical protein